MEEINSTILDIIKTATTTFSEINLTQITDLIANLTEKNITTNLQCDFTRIGYFLQHRNFTLENYELENCLEKPPSFSKKELLRVCVLLSMAFVSMLGNIATIYNINKNLISRRMYRNNCSAVYRLVLHLSIADVLVTCFCTLGDAVWKLTVEWIAGNIFCKFFKFSQMFSLYLSTYILVLIGIDRWVAVKYPMKSLNTSTRCNRLLMLAYGLSAVLSIPQGVIFSVVRGPFYEDFYQCHTGGFYTSKWQEQMYTSFTLIFMFIVPLLIIILTYLSTFRTISNSAQVFNIGTNPNNPKSLENGNDGTRRKLILKAKKKSAKISLVIVIAFVICWTPYYTMMLIFMFWDLNKKIGEDLKSAIFFFGMSNSLVNPIIYGAFHLWPLKKVPFRKNNNTTRREASTQQTTMSTTMLSRGDSKYLPLNQITPKNSIKKELPRISRQNDRLLSSFHKSASNQ